MTTINNSTTDYTPQYVLDSDAKDGGKIITSKYEFDLFHKEDDVSYAVYRVKFIKGTKAHWNLMKNNKIVSTLSENQFKAKQLKILHGASGFIKMLELAKTEANTAEVLTQITKWLDSQ